MASAERLPISGSIATSKTPSPALKIAPASLSPALTKPILTSLMPCSMPAVITPLGALRNFSNCCLNEIPTAIWPARTTVCDILTRHGLVKKARKRRHLSHPGKPSSIIVAPNQVWCADFKGQFKTRDGLYCYPLTITDGFSRYLLGCQALLTTECASAKLVFEKVFREFGLPERIRTDNGVPFATVSLARLSSLSAWWIQLGILPELIEPGKPQHNGRHERMHRTLKAETTRPAAGNLESPAAQVQRLSSRV